MCILFKYVRSFLGPGNTNTIHTDLLGLSSEQDLFCYPQINKANIEYQMYPLLPPFHEQYYFFFFIFIVFSTLLLCLTCTLHFHQYNLHTKKLKSTSGLFYLAFKGSKNRVLKGGSKSPSISNFLKQMAFTHDFSFLFWFANLHVFSIHEKYHLRAITHLTLSVIILGRWHRKSVYNQNVVS